jgi:hypothetical protein
MEVNSIVEKLMADESVESGDVKALIEATVDDLGKAGDAVGESADYVVEKMLEVAGASVGDFLELKSRVEEYWLYLDHVPGGSPYEVAVRAAEFLAAYHKKQGLSDEVLQQMVNYEDWRQRLVGAWTIRDTEGDNAVARRAQLAQDPFQDDNGIYLVREGAGAYAE